MALTTFRPNAIGRTIAALTALSTGLIAGTAAAAPPAGPAAPAVTVGYADLNLASDTGANVLYARIVAAAREVCAVGGTDPRDLTAFAHAKACQMQAIAAAVHAVHSPHLASLYSAHLQPG